MATLASYRAPVVELLEDLGEDPSRFKPRALRDFVLKVGRSHSIGRTKIYVAALRMFLRFLIAEGKCDSGLDGAIPAVAYWKLTNVPRYLKAGDVERIVAACNGDTPIAVRNRAVVLLLARLGLRVGDILRLRLQDIDWEKGTIQLCGKGRHQTHLPLSQQVGNALFRYVRSVRPKTDTDAVFVQLRAPFYAFKAQRAVSDIAKEAMRRAGVKRPCRGAAHLLRHSLATSMLRQGASLQEIAVVLRHRSIDATQIYAKVDVNALRQVAQRWPTRRSC